ncbi:MAG: LysR substrate-binding domain-containing protein [Pseudomonadota bacterium]
MADRKLNLPPFSALRAFHAAATHDRFRDAAETLGVTESAISHQVKRLEEYLHVSLIDRSGSQARLTETGQRYLQQIEPALLQIQAATESLLPTSGRNAVRLTLPPSLAANWLIPKIGGFEQAHTNIDLQLVTSTRVADLRRDQIDLAIRHGRGKWRGLEATFLLEETASPVCAPGYLGQTEGIATARNLDGVRLIVNANFPDEWEEWARAHGLKPPSLSDSIVLDVQEQALQLAENGYGLAMGRRPVVDDWLAKKRVIAPFGGANPTGAAYYLCKPSNHALTVAARRVERWLIEMAEDWEQTSAVSRGLELE